MKTKSEINIIRKAVVQAIEKFEDAFDVIAAMVNDDYISVSNFARVLNIIFDTDKITGKKLNRLFAKIGILKRVKKQDYDISHQKGLKPSRYDLALDFIPYSKLKCGDDYSFYMFKPRVYLVILGIDVLHNDVTDEMAINLIDKMKRKKYADVNTVKANLETFQVLMKYFFL